MPGLIALANVITDFRKSDGTVNAGGTLEFFANLTTTPKDVFNGFNSSTPLANPLQLDAGGFEPGVWLDNDVYRVRLRATAPNFPSVLGAVIWTKDNVNPPATNPTSHITTPTTLDSTHSGKYITTTANITIGTAASLGSGWFVTGLKNLAAIPITISRAGVGDTLNNALATLTLPPNESVAIVVNNGITGFDIYFNGFLEIGTGALGQIVSVGANGPQWESVDLINAGNDLYLYNNFT
jgi:hypothetical protein